MVAITLRADLSRGLNNAEIDANFTNLKTAVEAAAISANWDSVVGRPTALSSFNNDSGFVTAAGARSAISATGSLSYNPTTGVMSVSVPVTSVFGRTGAVTLGSGDVTTALGYTPPQPGGSGASGTWGISISGSAASVNLGSGSIVSSAWAGTSGYPGYSYSGGNHRFGFSSSSGVIDVYADGNFYATDSAHLVLHAGNYNSYTASRNGSGYVTPENWIQLNGTYGLYSPTNSAHLYPNDGSYGSWRVEGSRDGWRGINFSNSVVLMMNDNESGHHKNGYGWQYRWYNGTLYNYKNAYGGGTEAVVLDASNYTNYAAAASHSHSYVPLGGGTMSGALTLPGMTVSSTAPQINMQDTDQGTTRYLHVNGNLMGFLNTGGGWDMYANNSGQVWTANYGWLHDHFFRVVANCASTNGANAINCYGGGNILNERYHELVDEGGQVRLRTVNNFVNCNCACNC